MNKNKKPVYKLVLFLTVGIFFWWMTACIPYQEEKITEVKLDFRDSLARKIFDFQDKGLTDSLMTYFYDPNPTYRYLSARAFGAVQDKNALSNLGVLLRDEVDEVRAAAAFAIGQIGDPQSTKTLVDAFENQDTAGVYAGANSAILEAVGKCGDKDDLSNLASISTYRVADTLLLNGQAWGIYRMATRGITLPIGTKKMLEFVQNKEIPRSTRLIAANYLYRARNIRIDSLSAIALAAVFNNEKDSDIKIGLAIGLGKAKTPEAENALLSSLNNTTDYRVKCNIIRALGNFSYLDTQAAIQQQLASPNIHVATQAAQYFVDYGQPQDAGLYWRLAKSPYPWQVQLRLYRAANRHLPVYLIDERNEINAELRFRYINSTNPYEKVAILKALGEFIWNYRYIHREATKDGSYLVKTSGVEILDGICRHEDFDRIFGGNKNYILRAIANMYKEDIKTKDPGLVYSAAAAIQNEKFKNIYGDSVIVFKKVLKELALPQAIESYNELQKAIDFLQDTTSLPRKPEYNHPIDWVYIDIAGSSPMAVIQTTKGDITLRLLPNEAPGSVSNFIQLAKAGFYNGKNFHRVVPNFVIQGGCTRGDGFGALDYTIRTEPAMIRYDRSGRVGMASAGKDTESTQFFITHSPTPHLDGKYTIFAQVIKGMDVVHRIEAGDVIKSVVIK